MMNNIELLLILWGLKTIVSSHNRVLRSIRYFKDDSKFRRNLAAAVVRKIRTEYPVEDFSVAKYFYEEYQKNNPINDVERVSYGDWLIAISPMYPLKGNQYGRYYTGNGFYAGPNWKPEAFQVTYTGRDSVSSDYRDYYSIHQVRFATSEEIVTAIDAQIERQLLKQLDPLTRQSILQS